MHRLGGSKDQQDQRKQDQGRGWKDLQKNGASSAGGFLREPPQHTWGPEHTKKKGVGSGCWGMFSGVCWKVLRMFGCLVDWIGNYIVFS